MENSPRVQSPASKASGLIPRGSLPDYLLLHFVILLWSLTANLGKAITLISPVLVAYRTAIAAIGLAVVMIAQGTESLNGRTIRDSFLVGMFIGVHWCLFFLATQVGSVSVCLIGAATCSLWCALVEPWFGTGRTVGKLELGMGVSVLIGTAVMVFDNSLSLWGLTFGMMSAAIGAVFSFYNGRLVQRAPYLPISFYEMCGACFLTACVSGIMKRFQPDLRLIPDRVEVGYLLLLGLVCTSFAYTAYMAVLQRISVYSVCLTSNLEPVYGILLAAVLYHEHEKSQLPFWIGSAIIVLSVSAYPLLKSRSTSPSLESE